MVFCTFVLTKVIKLPKEVNIFDNIRFYASADLAGVVIGSLAFLFIGFKKSLGFTLLLSIMCTTLMMYIQERHSEYNQFSMV
jgi:hypothetical protein